MGELSGEWAPDAIEHAVVLTAVKDACAPLTRWPGGGPSLTAAARAGAGLAQVGTEG
jgi:hypothetical protein